MHFHRFNGESEITESEEIPLKNDPRIEK